MEKIILFIKEKRKLVVLLVVIIAAMGLLYFVVFGARLPFSRFPGGFAGPGGCTTEEECMEYCTENRDDPACAEPKGGGSRYEEPKEIVPPPEVEGKIKGYWSSRAGMVMSELDDAQEMKEVGINTITFSPALSHDEEGNVFEQRGAEPMVKQAINKAHKAGFRVMLETTPMNAGAVSTKVENPEIFQNDMTEISLKYAKIAEEYHVEYFAPIVEPGHHISVREADEWLQELLPKLRKVYSGPIMWKKQSLHLQNPEEFNQDHKLAMRFNGTFQMKMKLTKEHSLLLSVKPDLMTLEEWGEGRALFKKSKAIGLLSENILAIEVLGNNIKIFLNNRPAIEHKDDSGPMGGYAILSDNLRISDFEIKDMASNELFREDFANLNNWNARRWKVANGEIIISSYEESTLIHDIDFSGYDYIAIDTFRRGQAETNEHYLAYFEFVVDKTNDQAESDGVPHVIIAEFGGSIMEEVGWEDTDERAKIPITEEELAGVTRKVLEIAKEKTDGYIYNGWDIEGQGINKMPKIKEVIKDWYNNH